MTAVIEALPAPNETDQDGPGVMHDPLCHDENLALCGLDLTDHKWVDELDADRHQQCVVCEELLDRLSRDCDCDCENCAVRHGV